ncbi:MAG: Coenzyme F420 hydrogenase/dehydrogenase, beta subunit C-terminal domain [Candidatus Aenigmarchaeota archaeon]|nr:Coenzyme F420 hydrogenase/dehydrogenase, beta subunit C-terminal domain [Candidatus Aenigmarchaeota archaeon]
MKPAIDVIGVQKCLGCFGCFNACPYGAIEMVISEEGFYIPRVNKNKCTNCGICQKVCPIISTPSIDRFPKPIAYAAWSKNNKIRLTSSSGGIFSELANIIFEYDSVVYGVVWDERFHPVHVEATKDEKEILEKIKGSKYVPSYVGDAYKKVVKNLSEGKKVLFVGTPCQIAALNNFVNHLKIDKSNLYTVDLVCSGVPSLIVWKTYLEYISKKMGERNIVSVKFRDKSDGWSHRTIRIEFDDGYSYISPFLKDWFCWGFLSNQYLNSICYNCPFSKIPRQGDLTIGDFWGVPKKLHDEKGVSVVLVNSKKGKELIEKMKKRVELVPVNFEEATKDNPRIIYGKFKKPKQRKELITIARKKGFKAVIRKLMFKRLKRAVFFLIRNPKQALYLLLFKVLR